MALSYPQARAAYDEAKKNWLNSDDEVDMAAGLEMFFAYERAKKALSVHFASPQRTHSIIMSQMATISEMFDEDLTPDRRQEVVIALTEGERELEQLEECMNTCAPAQKLVLPVDVFA